MSSGRKEGRKEEMIDRRREAWKEAGEGEKESLTCSDMVY